MRNAILDGGINAAIGNDGRIEIRTGSQPATADLAPSGTLLATLSLSATPFAAAGSGAVAANTITSDTNVDASGTAGWARIFKNAQGSGASDTNPHIDLAIGEGSGDISFDETDFLAGGTAAISSLSITLPAS
jgi:hypothetical protein